MVVCSFDGASRLTRFDKGFWNVVSIYGIRGQRAQLSQAKAVHYSCFDDIEVEDSTVDRSPRLVDISAIFKFINGLESAPLMIHCQQGISRSAAVALSWIYQQLLPGHDRHWRALDILLKLRPQAKPNRLVLRYGLAQSMGLEEAKHLTVIISRDARVQRNFFNIW